MSKSTGIRHREDPRRRRSRVNRWSVKLRNEASAIVVLAVQVIHKLLHVASCFVQLLLSLVAAKESGIAGSTASLSWRSIARAVAKWIVGILFVAGVVSAAVVVPVVRICATLSRWTTSTPEPTTEHSEIEVETKAS